MVSGVTHLNLKTRDGREDFVLFALLSLVIAVSVGGVVFIVVNLFYVHDYLMLAAIFFILSLFYLIPKWVSNGE